MNLPKVTDEYGFSHNLREGSINCEGFIKHVKPHIRNFTKKWHTKLAEDTLRENGTDLIIPKMKNGGPTCNQLLWYHGYGSLEILQNAIGISKDPISGIVTTFA